MRCCKLTVLLGAACFLIACLILYRGLELVVTNDKGEYAGDVWDSSDKEVFVLENRMKNIESELGNIQGMISEIKDALANIVQGDSYRLNRLNKLNDIYNRTTWKEGGKQMKDLALLVSKVNVDDCDISKNSSSNANIQMLDVYNSISFENKDGGVWKQGWPLKYDASQWTKEQPLKVFVVPHSHNDPGWLKTLEKYYADQSKHILDNMVKKLSVDQRRKFIWAEISFFSMWWDTVNNKTQNEVRRLVKNGQLEIVTGGWVMSDEANAHYFAMLDQLIEGHQWIKQNIGVEPKSGWAIDPFGLSSTMAYLLQKTGLENMVIQRVHYSIKKHFGQQKQLEFLWRQSWDAKGDTDMFCHMMPFFSYDVPHTCGPDPKICCQFDFKRLPGGRVTCPWRVPPVPITTHNVKQRSEMLLDQYRKKAQLFRTNALMIQLGDDFRFDKLIEWDQQFSNYQKLFDYMNNKEELGVQIQFGTLSDYFKALHQESQGADGDQLQFPSLSGDFFTYADRNDNYWSGFYTSRPFYKNMDRHFESKLRAAEIIFTMLKAVSVPSPKYKELLLQPMMKKLVLARRTLGLFQHHDGITGTAKDHVVIDYAKKMLKAIEDLNSIISMCVSHLILHPGHGEPSSAQHFNLDEVQTNYHSLLTKSKVDLILISQPRFVVIYNSLGWKRKELVSFKVSSPYIEVCDIEKNVLLSQINPVWNGNDISKTEYELFFVAEVPALGLATFKIKLLSLSEGINRANAFAFITMYNQETTSIPKPFNLKPKENEISIKNSFTLCRVNLATGTLKSVFNIKDGREEKSEIQFGVYGTREKSKEKSGAYLFLPGGDAQPLKYENPPIKVITGPLISTVTSSLPTVEHSIIVKNSPGIDGAGIDIHNIVDVTSHRNFELVMRFKTSISNGDDFFTDLNGFQIVKRTRQKKLPIQANVYPMPSAAYIEDATMRMSILSGQSLGVASLHEGWLEVFLDRRLMQDDNRGVNQGVTDNLKTPSSFKLLWEKTKSTSDSKANTMNGFLSLTAHNSLLSLIHPIITLTAQNSVESLQFRLKKPFSGLSQDMPCNTHITNMRTFASGGANLQFDPDRKFLLLLHELGYDCNFEAAHLECQTSGGKITPSKIFPPLYGIQWTKTSLSALHHKENVDAKKELALDKMQIQAFVVQRQ